MSSNPYSSLNRRAPGAGAAAASSLFSNYPGKNNPASSSRPSSSTSHTRPMYPYPTSSQRPSSPSYNNSPSPNPYSTTSATDSITGTDAGNASASSHPNGLFNASQSNYKDQHSTSVLESLESQSESAASVLSGKIGQLKQLTMAIGDEIRDSSTLASSINDQFDGAGVRLRGTMRRMLRMAEKTGVGWRVWLGFFLVVWLLFAWIWLF